MKKKNSKKFRIKDLYDRKPTHYDNDVDSFLHGIGFNHVPEIPNPRFKQKVNDDNRIICRIYKTEYYDHERFWLLGAVYFDDKPVMVIQNSGRGGADYSNKIITNFRRYKQMVKYLINNSEEDMWSESKKCCQREDYSGRDLTRFHGDDLFYEWEDEF